MLYPNTFKNPTFEIVWVWKILQDFSSKHPVLLYGLSSVVSFSVGIHFSLHAIILLLVLSVCFTSWKKGFASRFLLLWGVNLAAIAYGSLCYKLPAVPLEGIPGTLHFEIGSISTTEQHFNRKTVFLGYGKYFQPDSTNHQQYKAYNFPCLVFLPYGKNTTRPSANFAYILKGILKRNKNGGYCFSISKKTPWHPVKKRLTLAEWRFQQKQTLRKLLFQKISNRRSAEFLSGMITGQFEDQIMRSEFGKHGLLHLMAISGFHFALLAAFLSYILRIFIPQKLAVGLIVFFMSSYFAFLGASPSVLRAWAMSVITLGGWLLEKRSHALNALGVSFILALFYDPLLSQSVGFQFSAAVTAAILMFYPVASAVLEQLMAKRILAAVRQMSSFDQHCYCLLSILREGLALAIAVNIIAVPLTLYYFQKFPVLSVLYNLFIPVLVSFSMLLILIASAVYLVCPLLGSVFFQATSQFAHFMLNFIYNTPAPLNIFWYQEVPLHWLLAYCSAVFILGIPGSDRMNRKFRSSGHEGGQF